MTNCRMIVLWMCIVMVSGCLGYQGKEIRLDHAQSYPQELAQKTSELLDAYSYRLSREDCIRLAMAHSLAIKSADLQTRMAVLDRRISFANFLPAVSLDAQKVWWDPNPMINFGGTGVAMHDKEVREITWNIRMAVLNPATWFLHGMYRRGAEISVIANEYTRQTLAFQVTALFYQCLSLEQMVAVVDAQLAAAQTQFKELTAWQSEGLIPGWQAKQAQAGVLAKTAELRRMQRSLNQARAELLGIMGLFPDADVTLQMQTPLQPPSGELDELMTEALLNHPSLAIADEKIAVEKEKIKLAIANFLPSLAGIAVHTNTSDSHQVYSKYWMGGLVGTVSVFNGFADVNRYKAAKAQQEDAFIQREQATLTLMIQTIRAFDQVQTAEEMTKVAQTIELATTDQLNEIKDQAAQGLVQTGDVLRMTAEADNARVQALVAQYQHQVSIATLINVLGRTETHFEETND